MQKYLLIGMVVTVHSASLRQLPDLTTITDYEVTHSSSTSTGGNAPTVTGSFTGGSNDNYNPTGATGTSDATSDATGATKLQQEIEEIEKLGNIAPHDTISREEPTISLNQASSLPSIEPTEENYTPIEAPSQTLEGYSPNEAPSQTIEPVLINPTISSTSTSADHTDPIIDEPSDSDPQVQIQLNQYNQAQSDLNRYNTAGKVLQQRVKVAEKNTMEAREKAEQRIQQDLIRQHASERGLDYQAKSTLPEGEGSWMP